MGGGDTAVRPRRWCERRRKIKFGMHVSHCSVSIRALPRQPKARHAACTRCGSCMLRLALRCRLAPEAGPWRAARLGSDGPLVASWGECASAAPKATAGL